MVSKGFKQTEIGLIPEDWAVDSFNKIFIKKNSKIYQIKTSNYSASGNYPIIDQGQEKIIGYTDDINKIFKCPQKGIIIFGDHTRIVKFINFNFAVGADGTQLLEVKENYSTKFMYFYLLLNEVPNTGYNRHFKFLKEKKYIVPPKPEQEAIAKVLSDTDTLIEKLEQLIAKKRNIKTATMQQLLKPKEGWEVKKLGDLTKVFTKQTGFDYTAYIKPSLVNTKTDDTIPFIQNKDFNNKWINFNTDYYIPKSVAFNFPRILLNEKSLLISISGSVGNVGVYDSKELAFIGGAVAILKFKNPNLIDWVWIYLKSERGQEKLFGNTKSSSHVNLILDDIRKLEIEFPKEDEQTRIAQILSDMDNEIEALEKKLNKYKMLKQGLMQVLLTGKIRLI
jgi:type I restriction enzyme S subunit